MSRLKARAALVRALASALRREHWTSVRRIDRI